MKGISPSGISIWIERANIHIRLPVEWNEPRKIYILSLNLPLEIPLQTLTHITACCWHEKRRDFVVGHLVYYSYFYWSSSFVLFVFLFDCISRLSSCKKGISWRFSSTISTMVTVKRLSNERRWEIDFFVTSYSAIKYISIVYTL